jgi:hypothetical protein
MSVRVSVTAREKTRREMKGVTGGKDHSHYMYEMAAAILPNE